jgi:hypothetical protein
VSVLALPLVALLSLHATPLQVGILAACETAAFLLVGLPAGAWGGPDAPPRGADRR